MGNMDTPLADLRRRIDQIDEQIHDLVVARAGLAAEIRQHKDRSGAPVIQPQRETEVLLRLAARHRGAFPLSALIRMWREMITAITSLQQPFAVAVCAPDDQPGAWDLARDHFGAVVPMSAHQTVGQVFRAMSDRPETIGIMPMPHDHDQDPWWRLLLTSDGAAPRIFARLPVAERGNARGSNDVLAIGCNIGDLSGVDHSLVAVEIAGAISRTKIIASLSAARFDGALIDMSSGEGGSFLLLDLNGPISAEDPRFADLAGQLGTAIAGVYHLGGYAGPIAPATPTPAS